MSRRRVKQMQADLLASRFTGSPRPGIAYVDKNIRMKSRDEAFACFETARSQVQRLKPHPITASHQNLNRDSRRFTKLFNPQLQVSKGIGSRNPRKKRHDTSDMKQLKINTLCGGGDEVRIKNIINYCYIEIYFIIRKLIPHKIPRNGS